MNGLFHAGDAWLHIGFVSPSVIHLRACLGKDQAAFASFSVLPGIGDDFPYQRVDKQNETILFTDEAKLCVSDDLTVSVFDKHGKRVHQDVRGRAYRSDPMGRSIHYFEVDGFKYIYGLGERAGNLNRYERVFQLDMRDAIGYDARVTDPLYKQIPFMIRRDVEAGILCGLFYDAPCRGVFDLGCERSGYWPRYCKIALECEQIDYYIILGNSMSEIVRRYTDLTGKTAMPPLASLGHMASTMYLTELDANCDQAIEAFIDELHKRGFGCDGYHLSSGYTAIEGKRCVFHWNHTRFPDPEHFARSLTGRGLLLSPNIKPAMLTSHPLYESFAKAGAFLRDKRTGKPYLTRYWGGTASLMDFLSPAGRALWIGKIKEQLLDKGINAIWDDNNEFEIDDRNAVSAGDPRPAYDIRASFANAMAQAAWEASVSALPQRRPYILSSSGFAGIQRYAQTWAGDNRTEWSALKYNVPIMLGMGVSGVANQGCDIGGFAGSSPDAELFVRWVQNGIFQPRFCLHSCNDDNTITLPWGYEEYTPYILDAFRLRYRLIPYYYALMRNAAVTGEPIMRPMAYAFADAELADESFDFMVGDGLLVANVLTQGAMSRTVRLPNNYDWLDWDTWERFSGGRTITVDAPIHKIPMFIKSGSIIPLAQPALRATPEMFSHITLLVEASTPSTFTLYQDDGCTRNYEQGDYVETRISVCCEDAGTIIRFAAQGDGEDGIETYEMQLLGRTVAPLSIFADGLEIPQTLMKEAYQEAEAGIWYYSLCKRCVWMKIRNPKHDFAIHISNHVHDLIGM